jgi:hypothetical protein
MAAAKGVKARAARAVALRGTEAEATAEAEPGMETAGRGGAEQAVA